VFEKGYRYAGTLSAQFCSRSWFYLKVKMPCHMEGRRTERNGRTLALCVFNTRLTTSLPLLIGSRYDFRNSTLERKSDATQSTCIGAAIGFPVWSHDSRYLYYQKILDEGEPVYRFNMHTGLTEHVASFDTELSGGILRCALPGLAPDDALLIDTTRGNSDLYRAELTLPR
jgi:hypothetical protein